MSRLLNEKEFKALMKLSRRKAVTFALGLGRSPEDHVMVLHRRWKGKPLFGALKRETDGITKGTWGTVRSTPKKIIFQIDKKIPSAKMTLRRFLQCKGIDLQPILYDAKGQAMLDSVDDVDAIARGAGTPKKKTKKKAAKKKTKKVGTKVASKKKKKKGAAGESPRDRALRKQLNAVMKKLSVAIREAVKVDPSRRTEFASPFKQAKTLLADGELKKAKKAVMKISRMLKS